MKLEETPFEADQEREAGECQVVHVQCHKLGVPGGAQAGNAWHERRGFEKGVISLTLYRLNFKILKFPTLDSESPNLTTVNHNYFQAESKGKRTMISTIFIFLINRMFSIGESPSPGGVLGRSLELAREGEMILS